MRRSYHRRSPEERLSDIELRIAELKAKKAARTRKDDPLVREIRKTQKRLKSFIQHALDNKRPDLANSAKGFNSILDRTLTAELGNLEDGRVADDADG